jgi:hypothetical protein
MLLKLGDHACCCGCLMLSLGTNSQWMQSSDATVMFDASAKKIMSWSPAVFSAIQTMKDILFNINSVTVTGCVLYNGAAG